MISIPKYLKNGFTITMWVRFKDKVSAGTLFNFGNPVRAKNPHGYKLETVVVKRDDDYHEDEYDHDAGQPDGFFINNNYERFVRLVVREPDGSNNNLGTVRDSHSGTDFFSRVNTKSVGMIPETDNEYSRGIFTYERIPIDYNEWYFVTATYDPSVKENTSMSITSDYLTPDGSIPVTEDIDFWRGNILPAAASTGTYTGTSQYGARCKVEIISRSDLLRARGYNTDQP